MIAKVVLTKNIDPLHKVCNSNAMRLYVFGLILFFTSVKILYAGPDEALYRAASEGNLVTVKAALASGANVNAKDPENRQTALMGAIAASSDSEEIVKLLIKAKASMNAQNNSGQTALFIACFLNKKQTAEILIAAGSNVDIAEKAKVTPLMGVSMQGFTEIARLLITAKAQLNTRDANGSTALLYAAANGHAEVTQLLVDQKAAIELSTNDGLTALAAAAKHGHYDTLKVLMAAKANVNASDRSGFSPLMHAVVNRHTDIVIILLEGNADLSLVDKKHGRTALKWAYANKNPDYDLIQYLRTPWTATPKLIQASEALLKAAEMGDLPALKAAIKAGAYVDAENKHGDTAIHFAAKSGQIEMTRFLIASRANVNKNEDSQGNTGQYTPLMEAVRSGSIETVQLLLEAGADPNQGQYEREGSTPLFCAVGGCAPGNDPNIEIVKILLKAGANPNANLLSSQGYTILKYTENPEIRALLEAAGAR